MPIQRAKLVCHHCGRLASSDTGGDLTCSADCRGRYATARNSAEQGLSAAGFVKHADVSNLWAKDGVHISIDQVIREGFEQTIARHKAAAAEIR